MNFLEIVGIVSLSVWALFGLYVIWHLAYGRIKRRHFKCVVKFPSEEAEEGKDGSTERVTVR
ncbi:MAG: hypothetical protein IJ514_08070 [Clostridia bacterium]|nr:hypothetical protein [Clostridia bacterium]